MSESRALIDASEEELLTKEEMLAEIFGEKACAGESRVQMYAAELAEEVKREWVGHFHWPNVPGAIVHLNFDPLLRYFGSFAQVDFTPCQQIKLDPPKPKREVKPAINLAVAEDRYTGLGWCDE